MCEPTTIGAGICTKGTKLDSPPYSGTRRLRSKTENPIMINLIIDQTGKYVAINAPNKELNLQLRAFRTADRLLFDCRTKIKWTEKFECLRLKHRLNSSKLKTPRNTQNQIDKLGQMNIPSGFSYTISIPATLCFTHEVTFEEGVAVKVDNAEYEKIDLESCGATSSGSQVVLQACISKCISKIEKAKDFQQSVVARPRHSGRSS